MSMRRGKRSISETSDDYKLGVEAEMEKWQQVADMIGGTLNDVCNMAEGERNDLVLLISKEKSRKDNINPVKDDDDVLLTSSDSEDYLYGKPRVYSHTIAHEISESSLKKVRVMIERCEVDLTCVSNYSGPSSSFNSSPAQNSKNSTTTLDNEIERMSPIFRKRSKNTLFKPTNGRGVTINEDGDIRDFKSVECDGENNERKSLNAVFQKVLSLSSNNKLNNANFLKGTLHPIVSNTEYFKAIDKNPQKYKLDKSFPGLFSLERAASANIEDIYQGFEGVKFIKSQAVCTGKEDPGLVSVVTDSSVRNGIAVVMFKRRELDSGSRRPEGNNSGEGSVRNGDTKYTRTTRNSINAASSDIFDDMFDTGAHDSADDFEIDYLDDQEFNDKGTVKYKRSGIVIADSDDDFKVDDVKVVKNGKKAKNSTLGTRRNPPGIGKNKLDGNDKRKGKATRGRGKGKLAEKDENQTSMLNFLGSNRIGNLNANEKLGRYDPKSNLVKLGGDQGNVYDPFSNLDKLGVDRSNMSSVVKNSHDSMPHSAKFGADRSDDPSLIIRSHDPQSNRVNLGAGGSSTLPAVERKASKTNENPPKSQTGTCPLCLKVQWRSELEMHAAECSGDAQGTGTEELCPGCLKLIPAEAFKDHSLRCNTE